VIIVKEQISLFVCSYNKSLLHVKFGFEINFFNTVSSSSLDSSSNISNTPNLLKHEYTGTTYPATCMYALTCFIKCF